MVVRKGKQVVYGGGHEEESSWCVEVVRRGKQPVYGGGEEGSPAGVWWWS